MNAYNPIQNVNTIIAERDHFKVRCSQLEKDFSMQSQNYQSQLSAIMHEAYETHKVDLKPIEQLSGTIESLKSQRELGSREFNYDSLGTIWCREANGKKKEVGYIKFIGSFILYSTVDGEQHESVVIEYATTTKKSERYFSQKTDEIFSVL